MRLRAQGGSCSLTSRRSSGTLSLWDEAEVEAALLSTHQPINQELSINPVGPPTANTFANALISKYARSPFKQLTRPKHRVSGFFRKTHGLTSAAAPGNGSSVHLLHTLPGPSAGKQTKRAWKPWLPRRACACPHAAVVPSKVQLSSAPRNSQHWCFC